MKVALAVLLVGLGAQLAVLLVNVVCWKLRRLPCGEGQTTISVLVPARNERENLPRLARALADRGAAVTEVLVCDDGSDDGTREWLDAHAEGHGLQWFESAPRPEGWTGKNWACHQLASRAQGEWLLFLDADTEPMPGFVSAMECLFTSTDALLVTGIPRWEASSVGDGLLVGMVPFAVFTTLPLILAERNPNPAFAFANGQVIAFRRRDYSTLLPHQEVRAEVLEDVHLAALAKSKGGAVLIADLSRVLRVRMYPSLSAAMAGFTKNAVPICRSTPRAAVYAALAALLYLAPIGMLAAGMPWAVLAMGLAALTYGACAALVGLPWWYGVLCPAAIVLTVAVLLRSIYWHWRGRVSWRGRVYQSR